MSNLNLERVELILAKVVNVQEFCVSHKQTYDNDKHTMLNLVKDAFPHFYESYPRICRMIISGEDLTPLFNMIALFGKVQNGEMKFEDANDYVVNGLNAQYVNPILESDELIKERETKKRNEEN